MELNPSQLLGPFLESVGQVQQVAESALSLPMAPRQREAVEALTAELRSHRARFEEFAPGFLEMAAGQMEKNRRELDALLKRRDALLLEMERVARTADEGIALADQVLAARAERPALAIPVPTATLPAPGKPLDLAEGGVLRELLIPSAAKTVAQAPRVAGNIWEDWRQPDLSGEDDDLGLEDDQDN